MPTKQELLKRLASHPMPVDYEMRELDQLLRKCGCEKASGGRGSGVKYTHIPSGRSAVFDQPHPGKHLRAYHIKKILGFLKDIGELE